jgi:hypothetical protein
MPPLISTIGGHQGASRLLTWLVFEYKFELSRLTRVTYVTGERRPRPNGF